MYSMATLPATSTRLTRSSKRVSPISSLRSRIPPPMTARHQQPATVAAAPRPQPFRFLFQSQQAGPKSLIINSGFLDSIALIGSNEPSENRESVQLNRRVDDSSTRLFNCTDSLFSDGSLLPISAIESRNPELIINDFGPACCD